VGAPRSFIEAGAKASEPPRRQGHSENVRLNLTNSSD
jgi:hypothetical protein